MPGRILLRLPLPILAFLMALVLVGSTPLEQVSAASSITVTNSATVTATQLDPNTSNNTSSVTDTYTTNTVIKADVQILKSVDKTNANAGDTISYTLYYTNQGPQAATQVIIVDTLPLNISYISASSQGQNITPRINGQTLTFTIPALAINQTGQIVISAKIISSTTNDLINKSTITATETDPDISNNQSQVTTSIIPPSPITIIQTVLIRTGGISLAIASGLLILGLIILMSLSVRRRHLRITTVNTPDSNHKN